jgi:Concanavalin A-like lectin/glucanases superfamily/Carboxypeptidase regulatory-like domain
VATDFNGTSTIAQSGVRNGRVRTLAAWVKPRTSDDVTNYEAVFDSGNERNGGAGSGIGLDAGKWVARLDGAGIWATNVNATLGKWQHVALAFNGSTATLFISGVQAATRTYTGPSSDAAASGKCFRVGYSQTTEDTATRQFFDGAILHARIHDRALTAAQIVLDADADGINDNVEADFGTNPLDPLSTPPLYTIAGTVRSAVGAAIAGATVYFADGPNAAATAAITATTDGSGNYSKSVTPGSWYVAAGAAGYNVSADRIVTITTSGAPAIDFALVANARVAGRVVRRSDGTAAAGASVFFSRSPGAASGPTFTAIADASGHYSQPLQDGTWYVAAGSAGFHTTADKTVVLHGADLGGIDFAVVGIGIPRTADLLFSAVTASLPESGATGAWPTYQPAAQTLAAMGSPTVARLGGVKWVSSLYADGNGFRQGTYSAAIPINGATIVVAVKPTRNTTGTSWTSIVDLFYNRLMLGIRNSTGQIDVWRNGAFSGGSAANAIPDGQPTVLSLVAQPTGQFKVFANGAQIMDITTTSDLTSLVPNVAGAFANALNVGRNNPDGWTTFNGHLGDVFVYKVALSVAERQQIEADLTARFVAPEWIVTATAATGGTINPLGAVPVAPGGSQTFTVSPLPGYRIAGVSVNSSPVGAVASHTLGNVTANQTIAASFATSPISGWRYTHFGAAWNNAATSGDLVDGEKDGLVNLLEYAFGGDPNAATALPTASAAGGQLAITFTRAVANTDVTLTVQAADSAAGPWSDLARSTAGAPTAALLGGVTVTETGAGATRAVEVRDLYLLTDPAHPRRFLRVEVRN